MLFFPSSKNFQREKEEQSKSIKIIVVKLQPTGTNVSESGRKTQMRI